MTVNIMIVVFWDLMPCSLVQWRGTSVSKEPLCIFNTILRPLTWRKQVYPKRFYISTKFRRLIPEDYEDIIRKLKYVCHSPNRKYLEPTV